MGGTATGFVARPTHARRRCGSAVACLPLVGPHAAILPDKGSPMPVAVLSNDEFYVGSGDHTRIAIIRDATGEVNGAVLNPGPWEQRGALAQ
jgi:hypothetical protein